MRVHQSPLETWRQHRRKQTNRTCGVALAQVQLSQAVFALHTRLHTPLVLALFKAQATVDPPRYATKERWAAGESCAADTHSGRDPHWYLRRRTRVQALVFLLRTPLRVFLTYWDLLLYA
jgi:hypothetical protein